MAIDFKNLLRDPRLLELFRCQSDLDEETFAEYLTDNDPAMFWQWLELEETLVVHYAEGAGETCFGVYGGAGSISAAMIPVACSRGRSSRRRKPPPMSVSWAWLILLTPGGCFSKCVARYLPSRPSV